MWNLRNVWSVGEILTASAHNENDSNLDVLNPLRLSIAPAFGIYRKTTAKAVNNTVTETDLLNGEITIGAGALTATGVLRFTAWGDYLQNSGGNALVPKFKLKLGATTLFDLHDDNIANLVTSATRYGWFVEAVIAPQNATNSQFVTIDFRHILGVATGAANQSLGFTTGNGTWWSSINTGAAGWATGQGTNTSAEDMTAAKSLQLTVTNNVSHASYETKLYGALVEIV